MNKKEKIEFINDTNEKFREASNHGNQGDNWWYPNENTIAYDVKMNDFGDIERIRRLLSDKQNEFYSDEYLQNEIYQEQTDECNTLIWELEETDILSASFAGRSEGWIEVEYQNSLQYVDAEEDLTLNDIEDEYKEARNLIKQEEKIRKLIERRWEDYNKYVDSKEYYKEFVIHLATENEINAEYQNDINNLKAKINK